MARHDLLAAHWMLAGQRPQAGAVSCPIPLEERVRVAAAAGFSGIGLNEADLAHNVALHGATGIRAMLDDHCIRHVEVEALTNWWLDDDAWRRSLEVMLDLGGRIGARIVKATGDFSAAPVSAMTMADRFSAVAEQARAAGIPVALEIIAFSNIADIESGLAVLGQNGGRGAGLMLDCWHFARHDVSVGSIASIPSGWIAGVEISDIGAAIIRDMFTDTVDHRRLPGAGVYDIGAFLDAVAQAGYSGPMGLEILSAALRAMPLADALAVAAQSVETLIRSDHR
ncbi:MAG: sugar phosphate isomerase/epimerase family protein [Sphingobium sp.]